MDYPVKTLSQLRPILKGFRQAAGLTQAKMAAQLGVTQQTYAQLEAMPASVSMERMFKVLRVLGVELTLTSKDGLAEAPVANRAKKNTNAARTSTTKAGDSTKVSRIKASVQGAAKSIKSTKAAPVKPTRTTRNETSTSGAPRAKRASSATNRENW